jgi:hypothetical protein
MGCDDQLKALDATIVNKCIEASIKANNCTFTYNFFFVMNGVSIILDFGSMKVLFIKNDFGS